MLPFFVHIFPDLTSLDTQDDSKEDEQPVKKVKTETAAVPVKSQPKNEDGDEGVSIFMKNLPWKASEDDVAAFFEDCGEVTDVRLGMIVSESLDDKRL